MSGLLDGRVVVVTGAARGIGRSHCLELARHGAIVVVNDVPEPPAEGAPPAVAALVEEITAAGGDAMGFECSVTDMAAVGDMLETVVGRCGRVDAVVNNAGILRDRMITSMTEAEFDAVIDVHLKGTWVLTRCAADHWRSVAKRGESVDARIINTTSGTGLFGNVGQANYGAAKAGIANLTMISAMELERYGVTVNAISPIARTRMTENLGTMPRPTDGEFDRYDPQHAAAVVAWLASTGAGWLTGAVLRIDGASVYRMIPWQIDSRVAYHGGGAVDPAAIGPALRAGFGIMPAGMPKGGITRT